ncbi:hypothetical protein TYRP_021188 [Tyrophagus putrescentiae]|nr:hypothetical protein TYRP_021188 [Tyrophagus putrescentiae]
MKFLPFYFLLLLAATNEVYSSAFSSSSSQQGPLHDHNADFFAELIASSAVAAASLEVKKSAAEWPRDHETTDLGILYAEHVPMSNLVRQCLAEIPFKHRERCLFEAYERFSGAPYPAKARCCTKWQQMECLERFAFNAAYCNGMQRQAVGRYFATVRSLKAEGSPECSAYRPVREETALWSSSLGRVAKCATDARAPMRLFVKSMG